MTFGHLDPTLSVEHFLTPAALAYAGGKQLDDAEISPLFADFISCDGRFPPTLISSGTRDLLLSDAVRLAERLREIHVQVDFRMAEGLWHVFEWYPDLPEAVASMVLQLASTSGMTLTKKLTRAEVFL